jgi:hypothetical protein
LSFSLIGSMVMGRARGHGRAAVPGRACDGAGAVLGQDPQLMAAGALGMLGHAGAAVQNRSTPAGRWTSTD